MSVVSISRFSKGSGVFRAAANNLVVRMDMPGFLPLNPQAEISNALELSRVRNSVTVQGHRPQDTELLITAKGEDVVFLFQSAATQEVLLHRAVSLPLLQGVIDGIDASTAALNAMEAGAEGLGMTEKIQLMEYGYLMRECLEAFDSGFPEVKFAPEVPSLLLELIANRLGTVRRTGLKFA